MARVDELGLSLPVGAHAAQKSSPCLKPLEGSADLLPQSMKGGCIPFNQFQQVSASFAKKCRRGFVFLSSAVKESRGRIAVAHELRNTLFRGEEFFFDALPIQQDRMARLEVLVLFFQLGLQQIVTGLQGAPFGISVIHDYAVRLSFELGTGAWPAAESGGAKISTFG